MNNSLHGKASLGLAAVFLAVGLGGLKIGIAADGYTPFDGERIAWHDGFARYDFIMDEQTLAITPSKAPPGEGFGVHDPARGQRRCIVVVPKQPAPGNPWSWRGCYWDHQPQTEVELLRRGFHIAYISANQGLRPGKEWDAWYAFLTEKHGLSKKPAFIGMSRGGEFAFTWAVRHPNQVACIYADNPGGNREIFAGLQDMADADVPVLEICGSFDPILGKFALPIEAIYQQYGGRISMMIKDGAGHHPHSLRDPKPIADFIALSVRDSAAALPAFVGSKYAKASFYSIENSYRRLPQEPCRATCRGPQFSECYDRYSFDLGGVEGSINVIVPKTAAPGKPWVYRAGFAGCDALVDLALLAKGFHIVTGPVGYNADGPRQRDWDAVYRHLTAHGFAAKPVMEGAGGAAGEVYAWAIANPDKVACIYAENPVLRSATSRDLPLDNLAPLAKARVPLLHVCGSADPWFDSQTRVAEQRYKDLGGNIRVIVDEGDRYRPITSGELKQVVDFIVAAAHSSANGGPFSYVNVHGKVTYEDGSLIPVTYLELLFIPQAAAVGKKYPRTGVVLVNVKTGEFSNSTSHTPFDGLVRGKHKVIVTGQNHVPLPKDIIPAKYADVTNTPLEIDTDQGVLTIKVRMPAEAKK